MNLIPEEADELLQRIDQPLTEKADPDTVTDPKYLVAFLRYYSNYHYPMSTHSGP